MMCRFAVAVLKTVPLVFPFLFVSNVVAVDPQSFGTSSKLVGNSSALLSVAAEKSGTKPVTVTFFGRVVAPGPDFTLVALPDTQYYTSGVRGGDVAMFTAQTDWIVSNRVSRNIAYVAGLGDIVDHGDTNRGPSNIEEWLKATNALYRLENPVTTQLPDGIPYGTAVGNHDQSPNGAANGTSTFFNQFFGVSHFQGRSYYGGHYGKNNDNHYDFFSAGGLDFIVVFFEYDRHVSKDLLHWADKVLRTNPQRRGIVVSHYIGTHGVPASFGPEGAEIYEGLKGNPNLFLMLSGHVNGEGFRQDTFNGNTITTLVSDYQFRTNGGNGFLRLMKFSPSNNVIRASTYSPWSKQFEIDSDSQFTISYPMQQTPPTEFHPIATVNSVSNKSVSTKWAKLVSGTAYEWYATVSDGTQTNTTPVQRFATSLESSNVSNLAKQMFNEKPSTTTTNGVPRGKSDK